MLFLAVILAMAFVSYRPGDVSWLSRDSAHHVSRNLAGPFGATLADVAFQLFGLGSYFLLVPLASGGWRRLFGRPGGGLGVTVFGHGGLFFGLLSLLALLIGDLRVGGEHLL